MSRSLLAVFSLVHVLLAGATTIEAQQNDPNQYDARALRLENSWGGVKLVRGRDGVEVGRVGIFGVNTDFSTALASSAEAQRELRVFRSSNKRAFWYTLLGTFVMSTGVGLIGSDALDRNAEAGAFAAAVGGAALVVYGQHHTNRAHTALSRSVWWYNRDLSR